MYLARNFGRKRQCSGENCNRRAIYTPDRPCFSFILGKRRNPSALNLDGNTFDVTTACPLHTTAAGAALTHTGHGRILLGP